MVNLFVSLKAKVNDSHTHKSPIAQFIRSAKVSLLYRCNSYLSNAYFSVPYAKYAKVSKI